MKETLTACPTCNGRGTLKVSLVLNIKGLDRCVTCDGKGKIPVPVDPGLTKPKTLL